MERSEILTEDWLLECWKERDSRTLDALDAEFIRKYRAKPLHNLNLFFFGAADETEQRHLHTLTLDNGNDLRVDMNLSLMRREKSGSRRAIESGTSASRSMHFFV